MIAKKNPGVDLERKRIVLFNVGLLTAGAFTLAAFTYSEPLATTEEGRAAQIAQIQYERQAMDEVEPDVVVEQDEPVVDQTSNESLGSESAISEASSSTSNTVTGVTSAVGSTGPVGIIPKTPNVVVKTGKIVQFPPIEASYVGGRNEMLLHMAGIQEYPEIDIQLNVQGTVYVTFVVETDGSLTDIEVLRDLSPTLDREAKRIVRSFPKWNPGEDKYGAVRTRVRLPIKFILE
ncbi:MAG: protein TonB [Flavobacteriaceae bacterium]|jgi:protein TonB